MYMQRIIMTPWPGKAGELTKLLSEQVRGRQAQGQPASLTMSLGGAGQPISVGMRFASPGDMERFREATRTDQEFQAFLGKLGPLLASPARFELWDVTVPTPTDMTPRYAQRVEFVPSAGKAPALTQVLNERIQKAGADGIGRGLSETILGDAQRVAITLLFDSLETCDGQRRRNRDDKSFQEFQQRISSLVTAPPSIELLEVLIPFQPVATREMAGAARR